MANSILNILSKIESTPEDYTHWSTSDWGQYSANCVSIGALKIQFGIIRSAGSTYYDITFKKPFSTIGYVGFASYVSTSRQSVTNPGATITNLQTTKCSIYTNGGDYAWLCIGF